MQILDYKSQWEAVGYRVLKPAGQETYREGDNIVLERPDEFSKNILERLVKESGNQETDLITVRAKDSFEEEAEYLSEKIKRLVRDEGVKPESIMVVNLLTRNSKTLMQKIQRALTSNEIDSIMPGFVESPDIFKRDGCVTITTPFRAKGNESNIVFVCNAQHAVEDATLRGRNAFFVAVTRSRGWVYLTGHGEGMKRLEYEINRIKENYPKFDFVRPSDEELTHTRYLLDKSESELSKIDRTLSGIEKDPEIIMSLIAKDPKLRELFMKKIKQ